MIFLETIHLLQTFLQASSYTSYFFPVSKKRIAYEKTFFEIYSKWFYSKDVLERILVSSKY